MVMIGFNVYKEGKKCIVTFSYDDGRVYDKKLIDIFNKYGIKGTFHLNSGALKGPNSVHADEVKNVYKGHEVSCHTVTHPSIAEIASQIAIKEVIDDRKNLEQLCGYPVRGMSYPNGSVSEDVINIIKYCGIVYSRTIVNGGFHIPQNFLNWNPTCHHRDALKMIEQFKRYVVEPEWQHGLLYIWGHSYELERNEPNNSWEYIEEVCREIAQDNRIWYATNIEIYDYITAQRSLIMSVDESIITNPTMTDVWIRKDGETVKVAAGQTLRF
ncbi:MAG: polysaccharide deacetylase family protein [Bacillota bacterium]|nr:polysaccharide deacetylase family protein [Bacillota bacterium]